MGGADPLAEEGWEALSSELSCAAARGDCSVAVREEWERLVRESGRTLLATPPALLSPSLLLGGGV